MTENRTGNRVFADRGAWISGSCLPEASLRAVVDIELNNIEIVDSSGPLLVLSFRQAENIAEQIRDVLATLK